MMKKAVRLTVQIFILIVWCGCKEIPPAIDFSETVEGLADTNYVTANIPPVITKTIFIEDLTGVRCNNCPKAAAKVKEIGDANPGKVVALAVYPYALTTLTAPWGGFDTLNTQAAEDIFTNIYNSPAFIPSGGVNRKVFTGESSINVSYNKWAGFADLVKIEESPIVINTKILSYDSVTGKARINVKVVFTKKYDESVNLSVYLTESKIVSKQLMPDGSTKDDYVHNHALRKAVTNFGGIPLKINNSTVGNYDAGRVFEKDFETTLNPKWKKQNCGFVILVNRLDTDSKEVLQAAEIDLL